MNLLESGKFVLPLLSGFADLNSFDKSRCKIDELETTDLSKASDEYKLKVRILFIFYVRYTQ